jgi:hypothetical protein
MAMMSMEVFFTGTDHGVGDVVLSVGVTAMLIRHNGDVDLLIKASSYDHSMYDHVII